MGLRKDYNIFCLSCVCKINCLILQIEISSEALKGRLFVLLENEFLEPNNENNLNIR